MFISKSILNKLILIITGIMFLVSSLSKLFPIYPFEFLIVRQGMATWQLVPYLSRLLIIAEFLLGLHLIVNRPQRKLVVILSISLLCFFSGYLVWDIIHKGIEANCGCFGEVFPMSTLAALIKNLVVTILLVIPLTGAEKSNYRQLQLSVVSVLAVSALVFIFFPVKTYIIAAPETTEIAASKIGSDSSKAEPLPENTIMKPRMDSAKPAIRKTISFPQTVSIFSKYRLFDGKKVDLDKGMKIVVLFSLDCDHCMHTLKLLSGMKKEIPMPPLYGLFFGDSTQVAPFFKEAGADIPYLILDPAEFFPFLKKSPPRICLLINGNIIYDFEGDNFDIQALKNTIKDNG